MKTGLNKGLNKLRLWLGIFFTTSPNHCFFISSVPLQHYSTLVFWLTHALSSRFFAPAVDSGHAAAVILPCSDGKSSRNLLLYKCNVLSIHLSLELALLPTWKTCKYIKPCVKPHTWTVPEGGDSFLSDFMKNKLPVLQNVYAAAKLGFAICMHSHN